MNKKINEIKNKINNIEKEIDILYSKNEFWTNLKTLNFELNKLKDELKYYEKLKNLKEEKEMLKEMLETKEISSSEYDKEIKIIKEKENKLEELNKENKLKEILNYDWDIIIRIEWWEGGEESNLFAKELFESYLKYLEKFWYQLNDWVNITYKQDSEQWWYKNLEIKIKKKWNINPYKLFFFENWNHQVMRVPATEKRWRTHTSVVKVKVMPIINDINIKIDNKKIISEWACRAWGKWGQNVNKRETAYQIIYDLWGWEKLVIDSREQRNQLQNKETAYERLKEKLFEIEQEKRMNEIKILTKWSWNRSDKIRTYQFQNNLINDTRTKEKFSLQKTFNNWLYDEIHNEIIKENF